VVNRWRICDPRGYPLSSYFMGKSLRLAALGFKKAALLQGSVPGRGQVRVLIV